MQRTVSHVNILRSSWGRATALLVAVVFAVASSATDASARMTATAAAPPAPSGVTATATSSYAVHITWTDNSGGAAQFVVQTGGVSSATLPTGTSSYDWSGQNPNTALCFTVTAVSVDGSSPPSAQACATTTSLTCQQTLNNADSSGYIDFYHGTSLAAAQSIQTNGIDLSFGAPDTDFGQGFYITTILYQAQEWARKNFAGQDPSIVHFRIAASQLSPSGLCGLVFPGPNNDFQAFVRSMRTLTPPTGGAGYDFVEGPLMLNVKAFLSGQPAETGGQQDSIHSPRAAAVFDAGFSDITAVPAPAVMVVGDSISQGSAGDFTWRYRFYKQEVSAGVDLAMVGPRTDLYDNVSNTWDDNHTYVDPNFDQHHDAIWGRSLQNAAADIQSEVATSRPEYVLVLLGINDLGWGISDPAGTEASLKSFVANARAADSHLRFVFGELLPTMRAQTDPTFAAMVADYNSRLDNDVAAWSTPDSPMTTAHDGVDIDPSADLWDGTHPNARGEVKIAAGFVDALANGFGDAHGAGFGVPYPRPYPVVPMGPQTSPNLTASPGDGQATLSWSLAPGATGYYVYVKNVTAGETTFTKLPYPVPGPSWVAGLLVNGATYQFQLGTTKGNTEGVLSNVATVTPSGPVPAGVSDLSASSGDGEAYLSWTPVANASGYFVYVKNVTAGDKNFTKLPYPVSGSSWTAGLLVNGDQYQFQLQSVNGMETGGMSNVATVTPSGPAPKGVSLSASPGDGQATLSWTPVANATGYFVYERNATHGDPFQKLPYPVSGSSWTAGLLVNGDQYQFQLQSMNGNQPGGLSNVVSVTPLGPTPAGVSLSASSGDGQATLSWTPVAHATGYFVYVRNVTREQTGFQKLPYPVSGSSWTASDLINGDEYQFQLQSMNGDQAGGWSNVASVTPLGPTPAGVSLSASSGDGQATLSWTPVSHATGYFVYVKNVTRGGVFTRLPYPVSGSSWTASDLINGDEYQFQLQSMNGDQAGGWSNVASVTPLGPTPAGVSDLSAAAGDGQATLSWTSVAHATGYFVYVKNMTRGDTSFKRLPYPLSSSPWTASGLINGDEYQFQLQSMSGDQAGGYSNIATVYPTGPAPAGVTDLTATWGVKQATLTWTPVAHATSYFVLYKDLTSGDTGFTQLPYPVSGSSWVVNLLAPASTYQFELQSMNGDQPGGYSNIAQVYILSSVNWQTLNILSIRGYSNWHNNPDGLPPTLYQDANAIIGASRSTDGATIFVDQWWNTNGHQLQDGLFRYQLWDITTGSSTPVWENIPQYPNGTSLTSWYTNSAVSVNPGHQYAIRVFGAGDVYEPPFSTHFSISFNSAYPSFDTGMSQPF